MGPFYPRERGLTSFYPEFDAALESDVSSQHCMTELTLTAIFEEAEEGGFIGYVAELPGANTQGETLEEVRENLNEAIELIQSAQA